MNANQHNQVLFSRSLVIVVAVALVFGVQIDEMQMLANTESYRTEFDPQDDQPDPDQLAANGIQVLQGKNLLLYADVRDRADVDSLPEVFDLAVPQWCRYFGISSQEAEDWKLRGCVMLDPARFRRVGLFPENLPPFPAGFQVGDEIWMYLQPGSYYTRHLTLHEGTHAFMQTFLGGYGAPWYAEGMAELLALNNWQPEAHLDLEKLEIGFAVSHRDQVPFWGRVKPIRAKVSKNQALSLQEVLNFPNQAFREVENYGWAWAACEFLSKHPVSTTDFAGLTKQAHLSPVEFNAYVEKAFRNHWNQLARDWELFVYEIDYGSEVIRSCLTDAKTVRLEGQKEQFWVSIRADRGWQETSLTLSQGTKLIVRSESSYHVGQSIIQGKPVPWTSTADGITLDYHRGFPLGRLLIATTDLESSDVRTQIAGLKEPFPIGSEGIYEVPKNGTVCFRINHSPSRMHHNHGELKIFVEIIP